MEPLISATALATIISLIGQFRSERKNSSDIKNEEFMSWLSDNRHEEIKSLLELNTNSTISIKALLTINHGELVKKLDVLDKALAVYASGFCEFSDLIKSIKPNANLSKQSISIIKQLDESKGKGILVARSGNITLHVLGGTAKQIEANEQRFLEDDLKVLTEYNFLRYDVGPNGDDIYLITRYASEYVSSL